MAKIMARELEIRRKKLAERLDARAEKHLSTSGYSKMWNHFLDITENDHFIERVGKLREKFQIPMNGFPLRDDQSSFELEEKVGGKGKQTELKREIAKICSEYHLPAVDWYREILTIILYNRVFPLVVLDAVYGLCRVEHVSEIGGARPRERMLRAAYPVAILLSPYAGVRDIIDFIKKLYAAEIFTKQKQYINPKIKIRLLRTRSPLKRMVAQFIYENRELPHSTIAKMVKDRFPEYGRVLIYSDVAKIIHTEKVRRQRD